MEQTISLRVLSFRIKAQAKEIFKGVNMSTSCSKLKSSSAMGIRKVLDRMVLLIDQTQ